MCQLTGLPSINAHIAATGPLSAVYKWRGERKEERLLLSLEFTPMELKIAMLWLPRSLRGGGLGKAILNELFRIAAGAGVAAARIEVRPGSEAFWTNAGFVPEPHTYWKRDLP